MQDLRILIAGVVMLFVTAVLFANNSDATTSIESPPPRAALPHL
ncbi:MAG: hypothetical protein P8M73_08800 [Luminiphilus sp.]|jgi:hypothetical protein|nr:hypothetical protein [Luminiphilus sp.]